MLTTANVLAPMFNKNLHLSHIVKDFHSVYGLMQTQTNVLAALFTDTVLTKANSFTLAYGPMHTETNILASLFTNTLLMETCILAFMFTHMMLTKHGFN